MHHSKKITDIHVCDTPKGTVLVSFNEGESHEAFEIELSPSEAAELISDLKSSLNQLATDTLRLAKES